MSELVDLQSQPLLSSEHPIDPALFAGSRRVEGGEGLGEFSETRVGADAVFDEQSLHGLAAAGPEEDHRLVDAVETRRAGFEAAELAALGRVGSEV
mgnify:CR=1 FL=1